VVDLAWDEETDTAHAVWASDASKGQRPEWAAISAGEIEPTVVQAEPLAKPGTTLTVLVTVDVDAESNVLATYRRPDILEGWYSRSAVPGAESGYVWSEEEKVRTKEGIGAVSVLLDDEGTAHMVLRDSTSFELDYFKKKLGAPWGRKQLVVDAESTPEIDFPSISLDESANLLYVFFQTNQTPVGTEVHVAVRDPATGWEAPYAITVPADIPGGAAFPTSIGKTVGQPIVLWTKGGTVAAMQAARVSAP
jgi:hypothetical protein